MELSRLVPWKGKSSVTVNVGVGLARRGRRVLVVDLDSQASTTRMLGGSNPLGKSSSDVFLKQLASVGKEPSPGECALALFGRDP